MAGSFRKKDDPSRFVFTASENIKFKICKNYNEKYRIVNPQLNILEKRPGKVVLSAFKKSNTNNAVGTTNTTINSDFNEKNNSKKKQPDGENFHQEKHLLEQSENSEIQQVFVKSSDSASKNSTNFSNEQYSVCLEKDSICINNIEQYRIVNPQLNILEKHPGKVVLSAFKKRGNTSNAVGTTNTTINSDFNEKNSLKKKQPDGENCHQDKHLLEQSENSEIEQVFVNSSDCASKNSTKFNNKQCRVCLEKGSIHIYGTNYDKNLPDIIMTIGCVEISDVDPYPKYLCLNCHKLLLNGLLFRITAQKSDKLLRETIKSEQESDVMNDDVSHTSDVSDMFDDEDFNSILEQHLLSHTELIDDKPTISTKNDCFDNKQSSDSKEKLNNSNSLESVDLESTKSNKNDCPENKQSSDSKENLNDSTMNLQKIPKQQIKVKFFKPAGCNMHENDIIQELCNQNVSKNVLEPEKIIHIHNGDRHNVKATSKDCIDKIIQSILQKIPETALSKANVIHAVMPGDKIDQDDALEYTQGVSENPSIIKIVMTRNGQVSCNDSTDPTSDSNPEVIEKHISKMYEESEHETDVPDDDYFGDNIKEPVDVKPDKKFQTATLECEDCGLQYNYYKDYVRHTLDNHPTRRKLQCRICNKSYSITFIEKHVSYHENGPMICEVCGKQFFDDRNFRAHQTIHSENLPWKCFLCDYKGRNVKSVKMHIISRHAKEKRYKCPYCPKRFVVSGNLQRHIFQHKGERPFKCDTCNVGFYGKAELKSHKEYVHLGIKKSFTICRICGLRLSSNTKRIKHEHEDHEIPVLPYRLPLYLQYDMKKRQENNSPKT